MTDSNDEDETLQDGDGIELRVDLTMRKGDVTLRWVLMANC